MSMLNVDLMGILNENNLDQMNNPLGTDKGFPHTYIQEFYQPLLANVISPTSFLEIGVWKGASCVLWKKAFPNSVVVGVDIEVSNLHPLATKLREEKEIEIMEADAYSKPFKSSLNQKYDLIIDDGPHTLESQINVLDFRQHLTATGTLVIEDVAKGIIHFKSLRRSLPKEIRKRTQYVSFSHKSNRFDDAVFVYSNSDEVLDFVRDLRKKMKHWGILNPLTHYLFRIRMKILVKLGLKRYR
jgi:predicted O-methyltransferase YrrM